MIGGKAELFGESVGITLIKVKPFSLSDHAEK